MLHQCICMGPLRPPPWQSLQQKRTHQSAPFTEGGHLRPTIASTRHTRKMSSQEEILALGDLPAEVLFLIVRCLGRQDLKHLRRACKYLASIVEPRLYEDVVVVPYQES